MDRVAERAHGAAMVVTDLDGTLMRSDRTVGPTDLHTLGRLGEKRVVRVVATGRSLYSARLALPTDFPIDYLIFSTGAGIVHWPSQVLMRRSALLPGEVWSAAGALESLGLAFMVHAAIPDNHRFVYRRVGQRPAAPDFERRLERYRAFASEWLADAAPPPGASQLLAIADESHRTAFPTLVAALPGLEVIRATSPLDGLSRWLEIFPRGVSKSYAAAWVAARFGIAREDVLSVGNDYNDEDLLSWAGSAFVVANAPAELHARHPGVPSNDDSGFSAAVNAWQRERGIAARR